MGTRRTVIHCNTGLEHQVALSCALKRGFSRHDIDAVISPKANTEADLHVVLGPWFALNEWKYANTLYIDRAYWGDPDCISIHWLKAGEKLRSTGNEIRPHPTPKPWKTGTKAVVLCDYGMDGTVLAKEYGADIRLHPADGAGEPLAATLAEYDIAIGRRTTALIAAAIEGLTIHTDDPNSPVWPIRGWQCDREQWLNDLAAHNWSKDEISRGEMWEIIQCQS